MSLTFEATKAGYLTLWNRANIKPDKLTSVDAIIKRIVSNRSTYDAVEKSTGIPWYFVGCLHYRESDLDLDTYLGNGQSLHHQTTQVPAGRGPWTSFSAGAIDALQYDGLDKVKDWPIERELYEAEAFNGQGYFSRGVNDPYVWSWTDQYTTGKFVRDGVFDSGAVDPQCGVAAIIKRMNVVTPPAPLPPPITDPDVRTIVAAALRAIADQVEKPSGS